MSGKVSKAETSHQAYRLKMEPLQKGHWVAALLGPGFFKSQTAASYLYTRQANAFATLLFKGMFELPHFQILIMNGCPDTLSKPLVGLPLQSRVFK